MRRRLYYTLKPLLPWSVRMNLRRVFAGRLRRSARATWPIDHSAAQPPAGWTGWPQGKQFAFVLTHDVEGPAGLAKCRQLAGLEAALGFRSSFNFIPEGTYVVQPELRDWLKTNGFEVGIHDLHHDGKLFWSETDFRRKAARINHYARTWSATGFRAGFMLRNLDWLHQLDIAYDASTFDTDPFEPQPDGAKTIFPFRIRPPTQDDRSSGYIELPYTLPQDSTLFLLLRERSPEIWLRKLDWIAAHGGMALVNVHPDYTRFDGEPESPGTFPAWYYRSLLEYVRDHYAGQYWQPLPGELAREMGERQL